MPSASGSCSHDLRGGAAATRLRRLRRAFEGETPILLRKHFPGLNLSERSLPKWWALQMANMAEAPLTDVLTIAETESALETALVLHLRDAQGAAVTRPLAQFGELSGLPEAERAEAVRPAQDALVRLSYRCFPSFRSLIKDYQQILRDIAAGKERKTTEQVAKLAETRNWMRQRAARARDYLDWFEITRAREASGEFDDYLRVKEQLKTVGGHANDPVSRYLDDMQKAFGR